MCTGRRSKIVTVAAGNGQVRLWTIQHRDAWDVAQACGVLVADPTRADPDFDHAYSWMRRQMRARLPHYRGGGLVWAWYQPRPDLRHSDLLARGSPGVRIEFFAPSEEVLLSDFDGWHAVLNGFFLGSSEEWEALANPSAEASWDRIFRARDSWSRDEWVQATLERVDVSAVTSVRPFTAR
jgi:hypothetical protein